MNYKRIIKLSIGIFVSVFFIYLIYRSVSIENVEKSLEISKIYTVFSSIFFLFIAYVLRIKRSQIMLVAINPDITFVRSAVPYMVSIAANNVLPFRVGDILRAINFSPWLGVSTASILAVMMLERLMDLLVIIGFFGGALFLFHAQESKELALQHSTSMFLILGAIFITGLLFFPTLLRSPVEWVMTVIKYFVPKLESKIRPFIDIIFRTLTVIVHKPLMLLLFGNTILSWFFEACTFYLVACAIPNMVNPAAGWLAMPVGTLSTALPSSPGYVGTFHYFVTVAARALGNSANASTAFAILIHLVLWLPVTLCGALCFVYWTIKRSSAFPSHSANSEF
jgi:uncharacterized protein (TIRG00374 family)